MDSKSLFLTPNADTYYFWSYLDLTKGPLVVEAPPEVLGIFDDMWWNWISDFGLSGPDRGQGGKYLLLPPGYAGDVPEGGYYVRKSQDEPGRIPGPRVPPEQRSQARGRDRQEDAQDLSL